MSYRLSNKTKEIISNRIGIPYEKLIQMEDEEIDAYIEKKTGKKITWPKGAKIGGESITSLEEKEKKNKNVVQALRDRIKKQTEDREIGD